MSPRLWTIFRFVSAAFAALSLCAVANAAPSSEPRYPEQWGLNNTGQTVNGVNEGVADADIDAPEAWAARPTLAPVTVAVLGTGVAIDHPDLAANAWSKPGEAASARDFLDSRSVKDYDGLTTRVAGVIGSAVNARGTAGVSPQAEIMALRTCVTANRCLSSAIVDAIEYADENGAKVVDMSFSGIHHGANSSVYQAIRSRPQMLFVASAGDAIQNKDVTGDGRVTAADARAVDVDQERVYPCSYGSDGPHGSALANVICVTSSDRSDALAQLANYGSGSVDLAAPGKTILSPRAPLSTLFSDDYEQGFQPGAPRNWTFDSSRVPKLINWQRREIATPGLNGGKRWVMADNGTDEYVLGNASWARTINPINLAGYADCRVVSNMGVNTNPQNGKVFVQTAHAATPTVWSPPVNTSDVEGGNNRLIGHGGRAEPLSLDELADPITPSMDGGNILLRYVFVTDATPNRDFAGGIYVDSTRLTCFKSPAPEEYEFSTSSAVAAAHVSGAASFLLGAEPSLTAADLKQALLGSVDVKSGLAGKVASAGRLNLRKALDWVAGAPTLTVAQKQLTLDASGRVANRIVVSPNIDGSAWGWGDSIYVKDETRNLNISSGPCTEIQLTGQSGQVRGAKCSRSAIDSIVVSGGEGDDQLTNRSSWNAVLKGGPGVDQLTGSSNAVDVADFSDATKKVSVTLDPQGNAIEGGSGDKLFNIRGAIGGPLTDKLVGNGYANFLSGGGGSDGIDGKEGDDVLVAGSAGSSLRGGGGADALIGSNAGDSLFGGPGNDTVFAGGGAFDYLFGDEGNDVLHGEDGRDGISGGQGSDQMFGGASEDFIEAYDKTADSAIGCGAGGDEVRRDSGDVMAADHGCEKVTVKL